jgi:hypothetical protein
VKKGLVGPNWTAGGWRLHITARFSDNRAVFFAKVNTPPNGTAPCAKPDWLS